MSELFILLSCVLSVVICVPHSVADNGNEDDAPVKYDGAQLWRIALDNENSKPIVSELQDNFGKFHFFVVCRAETQKWAYGLWTA